MGRSVKGAASDIRRRVTSPSLAPGVSVPVPRNTLRVGAGLASALSPNHNMPR